MLVPKITDINIKNNKIVFNDSVLPLREENPTLKLSIVSNVSQYSLERCIKTIFEHNLDTRRIILCKTKRTNRTMPDK